MQVTWSKDHTLRLWQVHPSLQVQCERGEATAEEATADEAIHCFGSEENTSVCNDDSEMITTFEKPQGRKKSFFSHLLSASC